MKVWKAWARKSNTNNSYCTVEIKAKSRKAAIMWLEENGYEFIEKPYRV